MSTTNSVINAIIWSSQWSPAYALLSSDASSLCTNSRVQNMVWRAYTFLVCLLTLWSTHTTQKEMMQIKFHGFLYIGSAPTIVPYILVGFCAPALRTCESSCPTTLQFLSLLDSSGTTLDIPYADLGLDNGNICWLVWAWPRFRGDLAKKIPVLLALSAIVRGARIEVSPEVVWEGARTRFPQPRDV